MCILRVNIGSPWLRDVNDADKIQILGPRRWPLVYLHNCTYAQPVTAQVRGNHGWDADGKDARGGGGFERWGRPKGRKGSPTTAGDDNTHGPRLDAEHWLAAITGSRDSEVQKGHCQKK